MPLFQSALIALTDMIVSLYLLAVILRFLWQILWINSGNSLVRLITTVTNPPLRFMRRFIPGLYGFDLTAAVLILLLGLMKLTMPMLIVGYEFRWVGALVLSFANSLDTIVWVFLIAILVSVVASWVAPNSSHPALRVAASLSEPVMSRFRLILPSMAGLDFSPILALMSIRLIQQFLIAPIGNWGVSLL